MVLKKKVPERGAALLIYMLNQRKLCWRTGQDSEPPTFIDGLQLFIGRLLVRRCAE